MSQKRASEDEIDLANLSLKKSAVEYKEEAVKLFKAGNYKEAIICF